MTVSCEMREAGQRPRMNTCHSKHLAADTEVEDGFWTSLLSPIRYSLGSIFADDKWYFPNCRENYFGKREIFY